jgi:hypothetical protein
MTDKSGTPRFAPPADRPINRRLASTLREVVAMTTGAESLSSWSSAEHVPIEELARRQGVRPLESLDDLACQIEKRESPLDRALGGH